MALQTIPGLSGYAYGMISSMNQKAIGKFTDSNHLSSLWTERPADYDKKIIEVYTQSGLVANDFFDMINETDTYLIKGNTDSWQWNQELPFEFAKVIEVPADTANAARVGIDGQEFALVFDSNEWSINHIIGSDLKYGQQFHVISDPVRFNGGYLYKFTLITEYPKTDFVDKRWLAVGTEYQTITSSIGEFDEDLTGLPRTGRTIPMFETLGSGIGLEHTNTGWADARVLRDPITGAAQDITFYVDRNKMDKGITARNIKWEPTIEMLLRKELYKQKISKMIWGKPGSAKTRGSKQEIKKISGGVFHKMRTNGNLVQVNKGEFTPNLLRVIFGDLFYRRVSIGERRVKIYTNESGFEVFDAAMKADAFNSGFTFNVGDNNKFIQGEGQNLIMNYGFQSMISRETGRIDLIHLRELDLPQTNVAYGQNIKSEPVWMVFDVSPSGNGRFGGNVRQVRSEGAPDMKWGYIDGRTHHLGHAASKGHSMASKFDGYTITMEDRVDVFVEDLSRTVLIEQLPLY